MEKYCIGIDVDKTTFKVCLLFRSVELKKKVKGSKTFSNDLDGYQLFVQWTAKHAKAENVSQSYVMEATGVYHEPLAYFLHDRKEVVHIVLPLKSKRYLQSLGFRSKTDKIDAKGLAMMGCEQELYRWQPASTQLLCLRSLTRQIEGLHRAKTSFSNQLEGAVHAAVVDPLVIKSIEKMIQTIKNEIAKLEKKVKKVIESDEVLSQKYALIKPLKGVAIMSFAVVVAETNGFALFKNQRQLVCYAGYDVVENQSGQRSGKTRISKKGNSHIRRILHMSSLSAVSNKVATLKNLHERVVDRTGIKMKGYVAVQRKLLVLIYSLWKNDTPFDPMFGISGNHAPKLLCSVDPTIGGTHIKTAESYDSAALDELPCNQLPEVLCSV